MPTPTSSIFRRRRRRNRRRLSTLRGRARRAARDAAACPRLMGAPIGPSPPPPGDWSVITIDCTSATAIEVIDLTGDEAFDPDCYLVEIVYSVN